MVNDVSTVQVEKSFYLKANETGEISVTIKVLYSMVEEENTETDQYRQRVNFRLPVVDPFDYSSRFMTMKVSVNVTSLLYLSQIGEIIFSASPLQLEDMESANAAEPFLLHFSITNMADSPIYVDKASLQLVRFVTIIAAVRYCCSWILLQSDTAVVGYCCSWILLQLDTAAVGYCCSWILL